MSTDRNKTFGKKEHLCKLTLTKYVLTTDAFDGGNYEGIHTMHVADFLLSTAY